MKYLYEKSIGNKTSSDNIILVKPFSGICTNTMKHYVSPDLERKPDPVILSVLAPTTLNLFHLKRSPMKLFHYLYPEKKIVRRLQFQEIFPRR